MPANASDASGEAAVEVCHLPTKAAFSESPLQAGTDLFGVMPATAPSGGSQTFSYVHFLPREFGRRSSLPTSNNVL